MKAPTRWPNYIDEPEFTSAHNDIPDVKERAAPSVQETAMPIWTPAPIASEPEIRLLRWRILETAEGTRHFVGCDERNFTGRVSSDVHLFDHERRIGTTCSGRSYQLVGPVGWSDAAQYVWEHWCKLNEVGSYLDVTALLLAGES